MLNTFKRRVSIGVVILALSVFAGIQLFAQKGRNSNDHAFNPRRVLSPLPPITKFELKMARHLDDVKLNPTELVLGVEIDGRARAYPINMLTGPQREIINDQLGETALAATW